MLCCRRFSCNYSFVVFLSLKRTEPFLFSTFRLIFSLCPSRRVSTEEIFFSCSLFFPARTLETTSPPSRRYSLMFFLPSIVLARAPTLCTVCSFAMLMAVHVELTARIGECALFLRKEIFHSFTLLSCSSRSCCLQPSLPPLSPPPFAMITAVCCTRKERRLSVQLKNEKWISNTVAFIRAAAAAAYSCTMRHEIRL